MKADAACVGDPVAEADGLEGDGAAGLAGLFGAGLLGGFLVFSSFVLTPVTMCHGATRSERELRARCQALGVTPEQLASREAGR